MDGWIQFAGPQHALHLFGVKLIGINAINGKKLLFSVILIVVMMLLSKLLRALSRGVTRRGEKIAFWVRQAIHLLTAIILIVGLVSIWFDNANNFTMAAGMVTAGIAFALQKVVTSFAAYLVILRGKTFNVGDRIVMGGVRGDVIRLGFMQTTIMEMGQPPGEQQDEPSMWVHARQYTGRIVTVSNDKIFDTPVYNYTRDFPYVWEEIRIPMSYRDDRHVVERILLDVAGEQTVQIEQMSADDLKEMERRYSMRRAQLKPRVYWRMTEGWVELSVRFIARDHAIRELKDAMTREILSRLDAAHIAVGAPTGLEIVSLPPLRVQRIPQHSERVAGDRPKGNGQRH